MGHNDVVSGYMISIGLRELMSDQRTPEFWDFTFRYCHLIG